MSGTKAFFQVVVALIPGLLFGGALLELRAERSTQDKKWIAAAIVLFLAMAVTAEVIAISGVIDPSVGELGQRFVVFVVVTGTVLIAAWTALPWVAMKRPGYWAVGAGLALILLSLVAQLPISSSLDRSRDRAAVNQASRAVTREHRRLEDAERQRSAARASALGLTGSPQIADLPADERAELTKLITAMVVGLGRPILDDRDVDSGRLDRLTAQEQALEVLNRVSVRAQHRLRALDLPRTQHELANLAVFDLQTAYGDWLISRIETADARRRYREACVNAEDLGCIPPPVS